MTNYTYQEKPKTVKAVQWDGTLAGAQVIDEFLGKVGLDQSDPLNRPPERIEFVRDPTVPVKAILRVHSDRFDMTWHLRPHDYLVTPVQGQAPHSLRKEEFESKYQKEEKIWGDSILSQEKAKERGKAAREGMDKAIDEIMKEVERNKKRDKHNPYTIPYVPP